MFHVKPCDVADMIESPQRVATRGPITAIPSVGPVRMAM